MGIGEVGTEVGAGVVLGVLLGVLLGVVKGTSLGTVLGVTLGVALGVGVCTSRVGSLAVSPSPVLPSLPLRGSPDSPIRASMILVGFGREEDLETLPFGLHFRALHQKKLPRKPPHTSFPLQTSAEQLKFPEQHSSSAPVSLLVTVSHCFERKKRSTGDNVEDLAIAIGLVMSRWSAGVALASTKRAADIQSGRKDVVAIEEQ